MHILLITRFVSCFYCCCGLWLVFCFCLFVFPSMKLSFRPCTASFLTHSTLSCGHVCPILTGSFACRSSPQNSNIHPHNLFFTDLSDLLQAEIKQQGCSAALQNGEVNQRSCQCLLFSLSLCKLPALSLCCSADGRFWPGKCTSKFFCPGFPA